jgi:DNA replication protein DnaC
MMPMPEIIPILRQLRLSGMLDALEIRNRQAVEDQMAYTEFLSLLLQDEIARRAQRKMDRRLKKAGLDNQKTLEIFDFSFNPTINKAQIMDLATCRFLMEKVCVLIVGPCGTGKSHIAQVSCLRATHRQVGHCAIRRGHDVIFGTQSRLLRGLWAAKAMVYMRNSSRCSAGWTCSL